MAGQRGTNGVGLSGMVDVPLSKTKPTIAQGPAPIIVTATMSARDAAWADDLRRRYYPPALNRLPAHLTLFRHLPPSVEQELKALLADLARGPKLRAWVEGVMALSEGVALAVHSPDLRDARDRLAERFAGLLMPQDQAAPRLHITVQNKVDPAMGRATLAELAAIVRPRPLEIAGLACWHYRNGPWLLIRAYAFRG